jgi:protease I
MARIVMPLADGFEDSEYTRPRKVLEDAGHQVTVLGLEKGETLEGKRGESKAQVDASPAEVDPGDFDLLLIAGGHSPDQLRTDQGIVDFVRRFGASGRAIAAVCHGPQLLIEADLVKGRKLTSWPSVRKDLENAGARWVDEEVVEDGNLVTSRKPEDLDAFGEAVLSRV